MEFKLIDTNTTGVGKEEEQQTEEETYEDIQQGKTKPTISILEKKRQNKTVECPNCQRRMTTKTYKYSHKCPKQPQPEQTTEKPTEPKTIQSIESPRVDPKPEPNMFQVLMKEREEHRQYLIQQKQERFDRLMSNAF